MRLALLASLLLPLTALSRPPPQALAGARFYPADAVTRATSFGDLKEEPFVAFLSENQLAVHDGESTWQCQFTANGTGLLWILQVRCGDIQLERQWTWLPSGRACTDLIDAPGCEVLQVQTLVTPPLVLPEPRPPTIETPPPRRELSGTWVDAGGAVLAIDAQERVSSPEAWRSPIVECLHTQVDPPDRVPCFKVPPRDGRPAVAFALLGNYAWVEGQVSHPKGEPLPIFEGWRGGRVYRRPVPTGR